jgi:hypothetical protein
MNVQLYLALDQIGQEFDVYMYAATHEWKRLEDWEILDKFPRSFPEGKCKVKLLGEADETHLTTIGLEESSWAFVLPGSGLPYRWNASLSLARHLEINSR